MRLLDRRGFLRTAAAFSCFPALRARAASPHGKVNMAFIGIGNRGYTDFSMFAYYRDLVNVVALCDTNGARLDEGMNAVNAYASIMAKSTVFLRSRDSLGCLSGR